MAYVGKVKVGSNSQPVLVGSTLYGVCDTTSATKAKVVTIAGLDKLYEGLTITVKFVERNATTSPTLNVSGTGPKKIASHGSTGVGVTAYSSWNDGSVISFTYVIIDGTGYWTMDGGVYLDGSTYSELTSSISTADGKADRSILNECPAFSATSTYKVGAMVTNNNRVYVCTTAVTTAGEWDASNWTATTLSTQCKARKGSVYMAAASWSGSGPWTQTVTISNASPSATVRSMVSLQPNATVLNHMASVGCAAIFITNNEDGTFTATAIQKKPTTNLTIQCLVEEVVG